MPTEMFSIGYPHTMVQNQVYALPARRCQLYTDSATLVLSTTQAFTASKTLTLDSNNQAEVSGGFIKNTAADALVTLKAMA